jgi:hypothetical protein
MQSGSYEWDKIEVTGPNMAHFMLVNSSKGTNTEYFNFNGFGISYQPLTDVLNNNNVYYVNNDVSFTPPNGAALLEAPQINIYVDRNIKIYSENSNGNSLITGYVYGPDSDWTYSTSSGKTAQTIYYEGTRYDNFKLDIIGGIYMRDILLQNSTQGIVYISPGSGGGVGSGKSPIKSWKTYKFSRTDIEEDPEYTYTYTPTSKS